MAARLAPPGTVEDDALPMRIRPDRTTNIELGADATVRRRLLTSSIDTVAVQSPTRTGRLPGVGWIAPDRAIHCDVLCAGRTAASVMLLTCDCPLVAG